MMKELAFRGIVHSFVYFRPIASKTSASHFRPEGRLDTPPSPSGFSPSLSPAYPSTDCTYSYPHHPSSLCNYLRLLISYIAEQILRFKPSPPYMHLNALASRDGIKKDGADQLLTYVRLRTTPVLLSYPSCNRIDACDQVGNGG